jgi:Lar family restriction alleviation protein
MQKLEPCPFCGGNAQLHYRENAVRDNCTLKYYRIECQRCHIQTEEIMLINDESRTELHSAKIILAEAWNQRLDYDARNNRMQNLVRCNDCKYQAGCILFRCSGTNEQSFGETLIMGSNDYCSRGKKLER